MKIDEIEVPLDDLEICHNSKVFEFTGRIYHIPCKTKQIPILDYRITSKLFCITLAKKVYLQLATTINPLIYQLIILDYCLLQLPTVDFPFHNG